MGGIGYENPSTTASFGRDQLFRPARIPLIELLVVVAIIASLAAMLMPALSRAKETGKRIAA